MLIHRLSVLIVRLEQLVQENRGHNTDSHHVRCLLVVDLNITLLVRFHDPCQATLGVLQRAIRQAEESFYGYLGLIFFVVVETAVLNRVEDARA